VRPSYVNQVLGQCVMFGKDRDMARVWIYKTVY